MIMLCGLFASKGRAKEDYQKCMKEYNKLGAGLEQELKAASKEWERRSKGSFASSPDPLSLGSTAAGSPLSKSQPKSPLGPGS